MNANDIKKIRDNFGISQESLAGKVGVHPRTIQNWEAGGTIPKSKDAILRKLEAELTTQTLDAQTVNSGVGVQQSSHSGDNYHGDGMTVHKSDADYLALLKKKDEQIDRLLAIIEKMQGL